MPPRCCTARRRRQEWSERRTSFGITPANRVWQSTWYTAMHCYFQPILHTEASQFQDVPRSRGRDAYFWGVATKVPPPAPMPCHAKCERPVVRGGFLFGAFQVQDAQTVNCGGWQWAHTKQQAMMAPTSSATPHRRRQLHAAGSSGSRLRGVAGRGWGAAALGTAAGHQGAAGGARAHGRARGRSKVVGMGARRLL